MQLNSREDETGAGAAESGEKLTALKQLRLGLSKQYYAMANILGLKRLQDYFQGLSQITANSGAVWILGEHYALETSSESQELEEKVMSSVLSDFSSRLWMTYRKGFPPLGTAGLTTDVGWGCTLRSGQMLLAQVLQEHLHGRQWRRPPGAVQHDAELVQLLGWFWDSPGSQHPFSIHNLIHGGRAHGIKAGEWLGPWTLCHALQEIVNALHPVGLHVHLANTPGGGAPVLYTNRAQQAFDAPARDGLEAGGCQNGLLLLIPLVLGIGRVNPVYLPQLKAVLQWPQSAGIVGGRPSSSLYFVGHQDSNIIFLDPHQVQEVGAAPAPVLETYFCQIPRAMPIASIDPSLAIAFYCRSKDSFIDLMGRLQGLELEAGPAPLLNVVCGDPPPPFAERSFSLDDGPSKGEDQWELL